MASDKSMIHRRHVLLGGVAVGGLAVAGCTQTGTDMANRIDAGGNWYVGTYSDAVYPLTLAGGQWTIGKGQNGLNNVAYGYRSEKTGKVWLLHESGEESAISRQGKAEDGTLTGEGRWPAQGNSPCYIAGDRTGDYFATANYGSGNVVVWREGAAPEKIADLAHSGKGPNTDRQEGPHSHWVQFSRDNSRIYSVDLGTDEILTWPFDATEGKVGDKAIAYKVTAGSGPRHLIFSADASHAYILTELDNKLITLLVNADGSLTEVETQSSLPADFTGTSYGAHIAFNEAGTVLYVSNRGHNSIGVFSVGTDGKLSPKQWVSCGGDWPRFFRLFGVKLWVANQNSNDLVQFDVAGDGTLTQTGVKLSVPKPVFIGDMPA